MKRGSLFSCIPLVAPAELTWPSLKTKCCGQEDGMPWFLPASPRAGAHVNWEGERDASQKKTEYKRGKGRRTGRGNWYPLAFRFPICQRRKPRLRAVSGFYLKLRAGRKRGSLAFDHEPGWREEGKVMGMKSPLPFWSLAGFRAAQSGREKDMDGMLESKAASPRYFLVCSWAGKDVCVCWTTRACQIHLGTSQTMFARVEAHRDEATSVEVTKSWNRSAGTQSRSGMTPKPVLFSWVVSQWGAIDLLGRIFPPHRAGSLAG